MKIIRRRTVMTVAAAGTVALAVPATSPGPPRVVAGNDIGLAIPGVRLLYDGPGALETQLDRVVASGSRRLRFDAAWPEIEYVRGRYDFSAIDPAVAAADARGLDVLLVLGGSAPWARPAGADWNHGPADDRARAGFAAFTAATARRYRGRVGAYEIWNEPNLPGSWSPRPDPDAYRALLAAAHRAIRAADPDVPVVAGGTGGGDTGIDAVRWYETLYRGGLDRICDAVAVHPYPDAGHPVDSGEMGRAPAVRAVMDAHGAGSVPLWGTETGMPTGGAYSVTEPQQAALISGIADAWGDVRGRGPLFFYTLQDFGGDDREDHFGLLRADGSAKPAFYTLRDRLAG